MSQRSILSFFSAPKAKKQEDSKPSNSHEKSPESKSKDNIDADSPIKRAPKRRGGRAILYDSDDEDQSPKSSSPSKSDEAEKENNSKKGPVKASPIKQKSSLHEDIDVAHCSTPTKSAVSHNLGFTPETVPPLRKTARKQLKRSSDGMEAKQLSAIKKLKEEKVVEQSAGAEMDDKETVDNAEEKPNGKKQKAEIKSRGKRTSNSTKKSGSEKESSSSKKASPSPKKASPIPKKASPSPKKESDSPLKESTNPASRPTPKLLKNPFASMSSGNKGTSVSDYDPSSTKYHPINDASWKFGEKVPYLAMSKTFECIENTRGRLKTIEILANFMRSVIVLTPDDFLCCVYLCLNKVAPAFEGVELGVGDSVLMRAIAETSGRHVDKIKAEVGVVGDLGLVAEQSRSNQRLMFQPAPLSVRGVFEKLREIALMSGHASQSKKVDHIKGMFVACRQSEARYLIRSLTGKLRIGLAEQSVLQAIAQAAFLTPPGQVYPPEILNAGKGQSAESIKASIEKSALILKTTYCEFPNYDEIVPIMLREGLQEINKHCKLTPGIPLKPMLAHPTNGVSEVLKRFENCRFTCEYKYDGERAQIHLKEDGSVGIYSRNQENNTTKYPDIISRFKDSLGPSVKSCVLDSEAVAWDIEKKQILPFQVLTTRKRKDANESEIKVQVCVFPFDLLYLNGEPLVREPLEKRRALLKENFVEVEGQFVFATSMDGSNTEDIEEFLDESIKGNCEGLMVKALDVDATYEIAKRSHNWLKLKKDYLDGVGDTIDVVVIGGYLGKGRRTGQYGGFLLACYDPENEEFQSLCKIGTGFTDDDLSKHAEFFKDHIIPKPKSYYRYDNGVAPDEWFDAVQVWEIKCADLSISPVHKAAIGIVDALKGISLRFPRFLRIRDDKTPEDATSSSQIAELYNNQDQIKNKKSDKSSKDEDFY